MTLHFGGGGHAAVFGSMLYTEYLVLALTVLNNVYTDVPAPVLLGVITSVLSTDAGEAVLG